MKFTSIRLARPLLLAFAALLASAPATAAVLSFSGTRTNATPGGAPGGRCGSALLISFAPDSFQASGTSTLGNFSYTASHCIAAPPPGNYFDGQFTWDFGADTLFGTYEGALAALAPGQFSISEQILFTGGTGRLAGATGSALYTGVLSFGQVNGGFATFADGSFAGTLDAPGIPEPSSWALLISGFGLAGAVQRKRRLRHA